jgi:type IV pilus assembly protein PilM
MFDDISIELPGSFSSLFKRKKKKCVGVDIGNSSIKIVELEKKGEKIVLKNYAISNINKKGLVKPGSSKVISSRAGEIVDRVLQDVGIKTKDINLAIPGFASLITTIELPPVSEREIEQIIKDSWQS